MSCYCQRHEQNDYLSILTEFKTEDIFADQTDVGTLLEKANIDNDKTVERKSF